jgi:hypothetical protein
MNSFQYWVISKSHFYNVRRLLRMLIRTPEDGVCNIARLLAATNLWNSSSTRIQCEVIAEITTSHVYGNETQFRCFGRLLFLPMFLARETGCDGDDQGRVPFHPGSHGNDHRCGALQQPRMEMCWLVRFRAPWCRDLYPHPCTYDFSFLVSRVIMRTSSW